MIKNKKALKRIIAISLLSASGFILEQSYEANATKFTRTLTRIFSIKKNRNATYEHLSDSSNNRLHRSSSNSSETKKDMSPSMRYRVMFRVYNNMVVGVNDRGAKIRTFAGVKLNSSQEIADRDTVLNDIKTHLYKNEGRLYSRSLFYELLNYEPNSLKRNDNNMTRVYKHVSTNGDIKVDVHVDKLGDFNRLIIKTDGRKHTFIPTEARYKIE